MDDLDKCFLFMLLLRQCSNKPTCCWTDQRSDKIQDTASVDATSTERWLKWVTTREGSSSSVNVLLTSDLRNIWGINNWRRPFIGSDMKIIFKIWCWAGASWTAVCPWPPRFLFYFWLPACTASLCHEFAKTRSHMLCYYCCSRQTPPPPLEENKEFPVRGSFLALVHYFWRPRSFLFSELCWCNTRNCPTQQQVLSKVHRDWPVIAWEPLIIMVRPLTADMSSPLPHTHMRSYTHKQQWKKINPWNWQ